MKETTAREVIQIEKLAAGGLGLARWRGLTVFLPGVLPGEKVLVEALEGGSGIRHKPLEIVEAHPGRVTPTCPLYLVCGGCQLQHAEYGLQLELKTRAALERIFRRPDVPVRLVSSPQELHYRSRVRFQLSPVAGSLELGFYAARSKVLIPIKFCPQLNLEINQALPALAAWVRTWPDPGTGASPAQMEVLTGLPEEGLSIHLDLPQKPGPDLAAILSAGPDSAGTAAVSWSVKGRENKGHSGRGIVWLKSQNPPLTLLAFPGAFTQINAGVNRLMIGHVFNWADKIKPKRVLDLFSGLGNFSLPLAFAAGEVTAVEENPEAVSCARANLRFNKINNVKLFRSEVFKSVKKMASGGERYDLILLDPPRAGAKGLAPHLARLDPREILYISCHPAALARDLAEFSSLGFNLEELTAYDMFPQTAHVEIMARLTR